MKKIELKIESYKVSKIIFFIYVSNKKIGDSKNRGTPKWMVKIMEN